MPPVDEPSFLGAVTDSELLSVILNGVAAGELLDRVGGLWSLSRCRPEELVAGGLSSGEAARVVAIVELAIRLARNLVRRRSPFSAPGSLAAYLALRYCRSDQESVGAVFLGTGGGLICDAEFFRGTLGRATIEPRQIIKQGLLTGAGAFALFTTNGDRDVYPTDVDESRTRWMELAAEAIGMSCAGAFLISSPTEWYFDEGASPRLANVAERRCQ